MSVRIHSNWTTHHKSSIYHAWFHLLPWIVTPDRRNCHTPLHILHRQIRPEMDLLEMSQDEVPHRSQVVRDNAVQSQARGKVWCRWRPRIAARNVLPQRRNIGSHYRHLTGGQNIPIRCSLLLQLPHCCQMLLKFLSGHVSNYWSKDHHSLREPLVCSRWPWGLRHGGTALPASERIRRSPGDWISGRRQRRSNWDPNTIPQAVLAQPLLAFFPRHH